MRKLVFVVGAGASKEVELPLGGELKSKIVQTLNIEYQNGFSLVTGDESFVECLQFESRNRTRGAMDINPYLHECRKIAVSMPQALSIDNFLDAHADNPTLVFCGKLAIAKCILEAEKASLLWSDPRDSLSVLDFAKIEATWYARLFHKIVEGCRFGQLAEKLKRLAFVVFNYDRCLEQFLSQAICNYYHVSLEEAVAVLENLEIHHPYGKVGELLGGESTKRISFGDIPHPNIILEIARSLRTFTEGTDFDTSRIDEIRTLFSTANKIAFLGFAYHRQNLDLIFPKRTEIQPPNNIDVLGTGFGVSHRDIDLLRSELESGFNVPNNRVHIQQGISCFEFFAENSRSLSLV